MNDDTRRPTDQGATTPARTRRALSMSVLLLALGLLLAACDDGGDDADTAAAADTAALGAAATDAADAATAATGEPVSAETDDSDVPEALEDLDLGAGTAVVTIGDATYEFSLSGAATFDGTTYVGRCQVIFDLISAGGYATDGRDITVDLEIPPTDWESYTDERYDPPAIEVEDNETDASWVADQGDELVGGSSVGDYEKEGGSASGTAMFVNQFDPDSEPVEGSFVVSCES